MFPQTNCHAPHFGAVFTSHSEARDFLNDVAGDPDNCETWEILNRTIRISGATQRSYVVAARQELDAQQVTP